MNGSLFERCLVEVITEMAEGYGMKQKPLAEAAWINCKDPGTKWRKIRNGSDPRGLRICDAYDLVEAMGASFLEVWGLAQARLRERNKDAGATDTGMGLQKKDRAIVNHSSKGKDFVDSPRGES